MCRLFLRFCVLSLLFSIILCAPLAAQHPEIVLQKYESLQRKEQPSYQPSAEELTLQMNYGKYEILNPDAIGKIDKVTVRTIRLIYTDHPEGRSFKTLNTNRISQLRKVLPKLFETDSIEWIIIKQTDCPSREIAEAWFHGFAFTVVPPPSPVVAENKIPSDTKQRKPMDTIPTKPLPNETNGELQLTAQQQHIRNILRLIPKRDRKFLAIGADSVSFKVFERNHEKWGNHIVTVSDWTASMYPYTTQVLRWHLSNQQNSKIKDFVFFNDGDKKRNNEKKKGKIGGIYSITSDSIPSIITMMKLVKARGDGGDLEENDIEALIWAQENHPEADEFALIADNKSEVRDMSLSGRLKKPVRIILGRLPDEDLVYLNLQYVDLAIKTDGSIHTFSRDYYTRKELIDLRRQVNDLRKELKDNIQKNRKG